MISVSQNKVKGEPKLNIDNNSDILQIIGNSFPENPSDYYKPVFNWIVFQKDKFIKNITIEFRLEKINTSSTKVFMDLFQLINELNTPTFHVTAKWYYVLQNSEMMEIGEFFSDFCAFEFEINGVTKTQLFLN